MRAAAEMHLRLGKFQKAMDLLKDLKDRRAEADCCMAAWRSLSAQHQQQQKKKAGDALGQPGNQAAAVGAEGRDLVDVLGGALIQREEHLGAAPDIAKEAARERRMGVFLVRAATAYHEVQVRGWLIVRCRSGGKGLLFGLVHITLLIALSFGHDLVEC